MKRPSPPRILIGACLLALCALALIVWSLLDPRPIPVIVAMSIGQVLGTLSFAAFLVVVVRDLRSHYKRVAPGAKGSQDVPASPR
jgi:hypothetical protein